MSVRLLKHEDVNMLLDPGTYEKIGTMAGYSSQDETMIHYSVTEECPFSCKGCINAITAGAKDGTRLMHSPSSNDNEDLERDIKGIVHLLRKSGKPDAVLVYYGGEPMLRLDRMSKLYQEVNRAVNGTIRVRYMVITSGHYLEKALKRYRALATNLWLTAVSIDGNQEQHDAIRSGTSLEKIRRQLASFRIARKGEVVVWSTLRPGMSLLDCFRSYLYFRERGEAEHFFWHWDEANEAIPDLASYIETYSKELHMIMEFYMERLEIGDLLSIIHINDLMLYLFTKKRRGTTACAVERMDNLDVIGDGKVHACADLPLAMSIGVIKETGEVKFKRNAKDQLQRIVAYKENLGCALCGVEPYCGGRCPVQANTGGIERAKQYCSMMREHVRVVKEYAAKVVDLMLEHNITLADLYRSAQYCKFTDVTP
jgi:radical SAM protein with 4Fe4S-binding SPASM domain